MQTEQELCFGPYRLNLQTLQLRRGQQEVKLTPKALAVLRVLIAQPEQVVTKDQLFQAVWPQTVVSDDALTTCILELRQALRDNVRQPRYIETVHRRGYRFIAPIAPPDTAAPPVQSSSFKVQGEKEAQPSVLPLPDKPSIAVLPFTNLSSDPEQDYFGDGLTDDLITDVSKIAALFVIARHSVFTYKGKAAKVQEISKELGVRYVLEGSVRKTDDQVRINAQLVDTTTGHHLWAERYDRPLQDLFVVQDEISQKIVTALKVKLTAEEQDRFQRAPTNNLEAYDFYLRGLESFFDALYKNETFARARQMFERAIALDSQYAAAHARLGETYFIDWYLQGNRDHGQSLERAFELAQRAVALDDALPLPHAMLGIILVWKKQHAHALVEAKRAVTLDPNFAEGYFHLGAILYFAGLPEEGIRALEQAMRLNPRYPDVYLFNLAATYRVAGRYEEALAFGKKFQARQPDYRPLPLHLAVCYAELDRLEEARAEGAEILRLNPNFSLEGFKHFWPMKDPAVMERTLAALRKAGLK